MGRREKHLFNRLTGNDRSKARIAHYDIFYFLRNDSGHWSSAKNDFHMNTTAG